MLKKKLFGSTNNIPHSDWAKEIVKVHILTTNGAKIVSIRKDRANFAPNLRPQYKVLSEQKPIQNYLRTDISPEFN